MGKLRHIIGLLLFVAVGTLVGFVVFGALLVVVAIIAPLAGLGFAALKLHQARGLWQSDGKFQLPGQLRVIEPARARGFALSEAMQGIGGFLFCLLPTFFVFQAHKAMIPDLAAALALVIGSSLLRRRLAAGARPVDILPKE